MNILFYPFPLKGDPYCGKLMSYLVEDGHKMYSLTEVKRDFSIVRKLDAATFNFFENLGDISYIESMYRTIKKTGFLILLKICGIKIYFTLNNKVPHDDRHSGFGLFLIKFQMRLSDKILLLCKNSKGIVNSYIGKKLADKKYYYIGAPLVEQIRDGYKCTRQETINYLFFGNIKPYKNIELLVDVWKELKLENAMLTIVGKPVDENYGKSVFEHCRGISNVNLQLEYVSDTKLNHLILNSDIVIEAFDLKSGINSATLLRAAALDKTMIITKIPLIYDFGEELVFAYAYTDEQSHRKNLQKQIERVYKIRRESPETLENMGKRLHEKIAEVVPEGKVRRRYSALFREHKE